MKNPPRNPIIAYLNLDILFFFKGNSGVSKSWTVGDSCANAVLLSSKFFTISAWLESCVTPNHIAPNINVTNNIQNQEPHAFNAIFVCDLVLPAADGHGAAQQLRRKWAQMAK